MNARERVAALRRWMKTRGLAAYLVPTEDPHLSEYVPDCWKRREWLSGFTGSAGDLVVTHRMAGLWTDSRYYLQAERELDRDVFQLFRVGQPGVPKADDWLARNLRSGQFLGADPRTLSNQRAETLQERVAERGARLRLPARNPIDRLWKERPPMPSAPIVLHPRRYAGQSVDSKLRRVRRELAEANARAQVVTLLDEIAWLFNIRSRDVEFVPLAISYAIVTARGAMLFLDASRLTPRAKRTLRTHARIRPYEEVGQALRDLGRKGARVLVDPDSVNRWVVDRLRGAEIVFKGSPVLGLKAVKNSTEVQGMRDCHVRDGVALVRFFHWIDRAARRYRITESEAAAVLDCLRAAEDRNQGPSFASIVSFGPNGAVIHYRPRAGTDRRIGKRGILLVDSGGQYLDGTTDVTRTVTLGKATPREKRHFTRVLKSHIALTTTCFPQGAIGVRMEAIARRKMWDAGLDYGHGTGHGVGHYLSVHEGPVGFGKRSEAELSIGNVISIEPGYYVPRRYGFRTENLVVVVRDAKRSTKEREWMQFEPLTLAPIDRRLIDRRLLTKDEKDWINSYHAKVYRALGRRLEPGVRAWLRRGTRPI
ncbi:MAG: M24 family metallopeptidase [Candidatus Eisenbacteria bacterium]|nr:M24 family metallopeptidase [Candidatus Eisenbacteria bacterium]